MTIKEQTKKRLAIIVGALAIFFVGWYLGVEHDKAVSKIEPLRLKGSDFVLTGPLIACDAGVKDSGELKNISKAFQKSIRQFEASGSVDKIGVYYRDLNSAQWTGINDDELFWPGSLMKVPTMMGALAYLQKNPKILSQKLLIKTDDTLNDSESYEAKQQAKNGGVYTLDELLQYMIQYSDNAAAAALVKFVPKDVLVSVYNDIGVPLPNEQHAVRDYMSPKMYSYFFRILYNADYLNHELSEYALQLLSQTDFTQGITAGTPKNITVAHKFGESVSGDRYRELHDCGIVYYPKHPYLLCVMTRGKKFEDLEKVIQDLSKIAYDETDEMQH